MKIQLFSPGNALTIDTTRADDMFINKQIMISDKQVSKWVRKRLIFIESSESWDDV